MSRFDWKAAYFNVVSLIAMIFFLFAAVFAAQGLMRMLFPALSMAEYEWESVESFSAYKRQHGGARPMPVKPGPDVDDSTGQMSEEELKAAWEEHRVMAVEGQRRRGLWSFLESLVAMVVSIPVLLVHRRRAKNLKSEAISTSTT